MKKDKWLIIGIVATVLTAFLWGAYYYKKGASEKAESAAKAEPTKLIRPYSMSEGPTDAKATIVEFYDPECEACRRAYPTVKQLLQEFHGKVRLVVRYFPLHKNSVYAASALEAARKQGKYFELLDLMFTRQPEWADHAKPKPELIETYAKELGLNVEQWKLATDSAESKSLVAQDRQDALDLGVSRTPSFYVNGKPVADFGYEAFRAAIQEAL